MPSCFTPTFVSLFCSCLRLKVLLFCLLFGQSASAGIFSVSGDLYAGNYTLSWIDMNWQSLWESVDNQNNWQELNGISGTTASFSNKPPGTYYYRLFGCQMWGCGASEVFVVTVTAPAKPSSISAPSGQDKDGAYTVSWGSVSGALKYTLQQQKNSGAWNVVHNGAGTSKTLSAGNGTYRYRVKACSGNNCSSYRASGNTVTVTKTPGTPGSVGFSPNSLSCSSDFNLSWGAASGGNRYRIQERKRLAGDIWSAWTTLASNQSSLSHSRNGLAPGYDYQYQVASRYYLNGYYSNWSGNRVSSVIRKPYCPPEVTLSANVGTTGVNTYDAGFYGQYTLNWSVSGVADTVLLLDENNTELPDSDGQNNKEAFDQPDNMGPGNQVFTYQLRAANVDATVTSEPIYITVRPYPIPSAPGAFQLSAAVNSDGSYTLNWQPPLEFVDPAAGVSNFFRLLRDNTPLSSLPPNTSSHTFTDNAFGQTYYHNLQACANDEQHCSGFTPGGGGLAVYIPYPAPSTPGGLEIVEAPDLQGNFTLSWAAATGVRIDNYRLEQRGPNGGNWVTVQESDDLSAALHRSVSGDYEYRVRACNIDNCSSPTGVTSVNVAIPVELPSVAIDPVNDAVTTATYWGQVKGSHNVDANGAFNYRIPIEAPPGINGLQPELSLHYNSNRQNGLLGWGWSLSGLSAITRCPASLVRDGYVSGINAGEAYQYCLDGARLVEVATNEYRTEKEKFLKIVNHGDYWMVFSKDGKQLRYGYNADSTREDSADDSYEWHLDRIEDIAGNYLSVTYQKNTSLGIHRPLAIDYTNNDNATGSRHRIDFTYENRGDVITKYRAGRSRTLKKRLKNIEIRSSDQLVYRYQLDYQLPGESYAGAVYDDPVSTSRLYQVSRCLSGGANCAEPLVLDWTKQSPSNYVMSRIENAEETALAEYFLWIEESTGIYHGLTADFTGDGVVDYLAVGREIDGEPTLLQGEFFDGEFVFYLFDGSSRQITEFDRLASVDGAAYRHIRGNELSFVNRGGYYVTSRNTHVEEEGDIRFSWKPYMADFNGDGKMDLYLASPRQYGGIKAYLSNGTTLLPSSAYSIAGGQTAAAVEWRFDVGSKNYTVEETLGYRLLFRDYNGDGLLDILRIPPYIHRDHGTWISAPNDISVALNNGSGFDAFSQWTTVTNFPDIVYIGSTVVALVNDVNGDGLADLVADNGQVALNTGDSFATAQNWGQVLHSGLDRNQPFDDLFLMGTPAINATQLVDMNGDNLADLVRFFPDTDAGEFEIYVNLSNGQQFLAPEYWGAFPGIITSSSSSCCLIRIFDYNRDGISDIVYNSWGKLYDPIFPTFTPKDINHDYRLLISKGGLIGTATEAFAERVSIYPAGDLAVMQQYSILTSSYDPIYDDYPFQDIDGDSFVDKANFRSDRMQKSLITDIRTAGEQTLTIDYQSFGRAEIYRQKDENGELRIANTLIQESNSTAAVDRDNSHIYQAGFKSGRYLPMTHGVASITMSDGGGGNNTDHYYYQDGKVHLSGYGFLGFGNVEKTTGFAGLTDKLRTVSEYHQALDLAYKLNTELKRQKVCLLGSGDSLGSGCDNDDTTLIEEKNYWQVRLYQDSLNSNFDNPHFFPYIADRSIQSWDLNGTGISVQRTQYDPSQALGCDALTDAKSDSIDAFVAGSAGDNSYHVDGVPLSVRATTCGQSNGANAVVSETTLNSDITSIKTSGNWVLGLIGRSQKSARTGSNVATLGAAQTRTAEYDYILSGSQAGKLLSQTREPDNATQKLTTTYEYNDYGSISRLTETWNNVTSDGLDFTSRETIYTETIDNNSQRSVTVTNPLGHTTITDYHPVWGTPAEVIDVNGLITRHDYDAIGRLQTTTYADGTQTHMDYAKCNNCFSYNDNAQWFSQQKTTGQSALRTYFDSRDREIGQRIRGLNGEFIYAYQIYDSRGNPAQTSDPFFSGDSIAVTSYGYDLLNRNTITTFADGSHSSITYNGLTQTLTNRLGREQTRQHNGAGWVVQSRDDDNIPVDFTYWPFGELQSTEVNNIAATLVMIDYDNLGRKTRLDDPNTGIIDYTYNPLGLVATETDARGIVTQYHYDKLERQIARANNAGTFNGRDVIHTWIYDNKSHGVGLLGTLSGSNSDGSNFTEQYSYNTLSLPETTTTSFGGQSYTVQQHYDDFSRVIGATYPSGYSLVTYYNNYGYIQRRDDMADGKDLWVANTMDARGNLTQFVLKNGVVTDRSYDNITGRIDTIQVYKDNLTLQDHDYDFDALGNLTQRQDLHNNLTQSFCYDNLNRLVAASFSGCSSSGGDFSYDALGNIKTKTGVTGTYQYGDNAGPNAVTSADGLTYQYDASGNLQSAKNTANQVVKSVIYSTFNKPTRITDSGNTTDIVYGPHQRRIKRTDSSGRTTVYIGDSYEETSLHGIVEQVHYLDDFGLYIRQSGAANARYYRYLHRDHIGSIVAQSQDNIGSANTIEWLSNDPWGARLLGDWNGMGAGKGYLPEATARGFTGHEHLDEVGLIHMNGRVYDPTLGRFLSPDPLVQSPYNSQSYNRYSYVFNNPLSFTDPSGFEAMSEITVTAERIEDFDFVEQFYPTLGIDLMNLTPMMGTEFDDSYLQRDYEMPELSSGFCGGVYGGDGCVQEGDESLGSITSIVSSALTSADVANTVAMCKSGVCFNQWQGGNGKWYNLGWGGNQWAGARRFALFNTRSFKSVGRGLTVFSVGVEMTEFGSAYVKKDSFGMLDSMVDMGAMVPAFVGGLPGFVFSTSYSVTDNTFGPALSAAIADGACKLTDC